MQRLLFRVQSAIKSMARACGLEVRYAFQNPPVTDPRIYARWLPQQKVTCVFDVGANIGQSARAFADAFPAATVYSFEPFPATYRQLERAAQASGGRIKAFCLGCGDQDGCLLVHVDPASVSELNRIDGQQPGGVPAGVKPTEIQLARLDTFCAQQGVESIDLLKTDTEGYDLKVLSGASRMLAEGRVRCIVSEIGFLDDPQHTELGALVRFLHSYRFEPAGVYQISYNRALESTFANAIFVRRG